MATKRRKKYVGKVSEWFEDALGSLNDAKEEIEYKAQAVETAVEYFELHGLDAAKVKKAVGEMKVAIHLPVRSATHGAERAAYILSQLADYVRHREEKLTGEVAKIEAAMKKLTGKDGKPVNAHAAKVLRRLSRQRHKLERFIEDAELGSVEDALSEAAQEAGDAA